MLLGALSVGVLTARDRVRPGEPGEGGDPSAAETGAAETGAEGAARDAEPDRRSDAD